MSGKHERAIASLDQLHTSSRTKSPGITAPPRSAEKRKRGGGAGSKEGAKKSRRADDNPASTVAEDDAPFYETLPTSYIRSHSKKAASDNFVENFVTGLLPDGSEAEKVLRTKVQGKAVPLDNPKRAFSVDLERKKKLRGQSRRNKTMSAKERRALHFHEVPTANRTLRYDDFLPLHNLWRSHFDDMLGSTSPVGNEVTVLKADYHGAILTVTRSKCPSYVGLTGIVIQETENVFKVVTNADGLKCVPKKNNVFLLKWNENDILLYGNQLMFRAFERTVRKFKFKATIEL